MNFRKPQLLLIALCAAVIAQNSRGIDIFKVGNSGLRSNMITCVAVDSINVIYAGTDVGIFRFDGKSWIWWNQTAYGIKSDHITVAAISADDKIWMGTSSGFCRELNGKWSIMNSESYISSMAVVPKGGMLVGASGGIAYFNGTTWANYESSASTFPPSSISAVAVDGSGNWWIGTKGSGVSRFNGTDWKTYTAASSPLPGDSIASIAIDRKGVPWFCTQRGYNSFDAGTWSRAGEKSPASSEDRGASGMAFDTGNVQWVAMRKKGLVRLKSGGAAWFSTTTGALLRDEVSSVAVDRTNNIWAGTLGGGLVRINTGIVKSPERQNTGACAGPLCWDLYTSASSPLSSDNVTAVLFKDFRIWCGTWGGGMVKLPGCDPFDLQKYPPWEVFIRENSRMPDDRINCMASAKNGNIWIGTENGLVRIIPEVLFYPATYTVYQTSNSGLPNNSVRALAFRDDTVWVGTWGGGLAKFNGKSWQVFTSANSRLPGDTISALNVYRTSEIWIGTWGKGLACYEKTYRNEDSWRIFSSATSALPGNFITSLYHEEYPDTPLWIGTTNGLARICDDAWSVWNTGNSKIPGNYIRDIAINALDDIAIATDNNGLAIKLKRADWAVLNTANGFPCNRVRALAYDDKKFAWFAATDKGLARVTVPVTRGGFGELGLP